MDAADAAAVLHMSTLSAVMQEGHSLSVWNSDTLR